MILPKTFLVSFLFFATSNLYSQDFFRYFQNHLKPRLPEGWTMRPYRDSLFAFNKVVHWQEMLDPPPDSFGYDDTMTLFVRFHPVMNDSAQIINSRILDRLKMEMKELKEHRLDSIYRGKKGFYDWWGKVVSIKTQQEMFSFLYFKNCSINFSYWKLYDGLKYYDEKIDEEAEQIKTTIAAYLKGD